MCRLENGMDANIHEDGCEFFKGDQNSVDVGSIVTGRITKIHFGENNNEHSESKPFEDNFSVSLMCKQSDLRNHGMFFEK